MKEKPTDNRIFTGSDAPMTGEQARNLIKSPEYDKYQMAKIKKIVTGDGVFDRQKQIESERNMVIDFIRHTKGGELLAMILKCFFAGYSDKRIAKTLMKTKTPGFYFHSLAKAIKFVEQAKEEAKYRVQVEISKRSVMPVFH